MKPWRRKQRARPAGLITVLRDKSLIPLSHQHQHALALCVRIDRASPIRSTDLAAWQSEITQLFQNEIRVHFDAEERIVFPAAQAFEALSALVEELLQDHVRLRESFAQTEAGKMSPTDLTALAQFLAGHIRKEERQLFERLQELMPKDELANLGRELDEALKAAEQACILPTRATKLQGRKAAKGEA